MVTIMLLVANTILSFLLSLSCPCSCHLTCLKILRYADLNVERGQKIVLRKLGGWGAGFPRRPASSSKRFASPALKEPVYERDEKYGRVQPDPNGNVPTPGGTLFPAQLSVGTHRPAAEVFELLNNPWNCKL